MSEFSASHLINKNVDFDAIVDLINESYSINKHKDFYTWLFTKVNTFIPHHLFISCWGRFDKAFSNQDLNFDVASNLDDFSVDELKQSQQLNLFVRSLYKAWVNNGHRWYILDNLNALDKDHPLNPSFFTDKSQTNSLIVYGISDIRSGIECIYVFCNQAINFKTQNYVMGYLMPHIDNSLRRATQTRLYEKNNTLPAKVLVLSTLTNREIEIIELIKLGKTNKEIGFTLHISYHTVKIHLKRIFEKLKVSKRAQLVSFFET